MLITTATGELVTTATGVLLLAGEVTDPPDPPEPTDGYPATYTATYGG